MDWDEGTSFMNPWNELDQVSYWQQRDARRAHRTQHACFKIVIMRLLLLLVGLFATLTGAPQLHEAKEPLRASRCAIGCAAAVRLVVLPCGRFSTGVKHCRFQLQNAFLSIQKLA